MQEVIIVLGVHNSQMMKITANALLVVEKMSMFEIFIKVGRYDIQCTSDVLV
jgi:hypothetical protein